MQFKGTWISTRCVNLGNVWMGFVHFVVVFGVCIDSLTLNWLRTCLLYQENRKGEPGVSFSKVVDCGKLLSRGYCLRNYDIIISGTNDR